MGRGLAANYSAVGKKKPAKVKNVCKIKVKLEEKPTQKDQISVAWLPIAKFCNGNSVIRANPLQDQNLRRTFFVKW